MPRSLFGQLLIVLLIFGGAVTAVCFVVIRVSHEHYHRELDQTVNRELARQYVDDRFMLGDSALTWRGVERAIARLATINPDVDLYVLNGDGRILASSIPSAELPVNTVDIDPVRQFVADDTQLPILGTDPRGDAARQVFSAAPMNVPGSSARYLYLVLHRQDGQSTTRRLKLNHEIGESTGVVLVAAILALIGSVVIMRTVTHRLALLDGAMQQFRRSNFSQPAQATILPPMEQYDEIDRLTYIFGELTQRIEAQVAELKRTDSMRRELFANVSHDLRTPLATLQAHLDSLAMAESNLTEPERAEYLTTATRQCRRLGRLVDQLMQVAKLESNQFAVQNEPFQLVELVHDVAQKFEPRARQSGVHLSVDRVDEVPLVRADIGLIERVLDNLIDNALYHTPAGGHVRLQLSTDGSAVRCTVSDSGRGIPADELPKLFERFYRSDGMRIGADGHTGLGLSIVKQILALHGTSIQVRSDLGLGTAFWFELPVVGAHLLPTEDSRSG